MSSTFSTGDDIIHSAIARSDLRIDDVDDYFDIAATAAQIDAKHCVRIALQFPDDLLPYSIPIYKRLKALLANVQLFILADTSYGSCCVDEVAAQHTNADCIVHYGYACLSKTARLPVIYVFGKSALSIPDLASSFSSLSLVQPLYLTHDPSYTHLAPAIREAVGASPDPLPSTNDECTVLYIGADPASSLHLTNLQMTHSRATFFAYSPTTNTLESSRSSKLLMRRYTQIQRARDADVFGILVGTLGVKDYLPLISHLRQLLKTHHKKSYTISVGKLNPSKLANFLEIECFVLVACPENSLIESKEFLRPIITPFELEIALSKEPKWDGSYILDFERLLPPSTNNVTQNPTPPSPSPEPSPSDSEDSDAPHFSLITGTYKHSKRYTSSTTASAQPASTDDNSLILRTTDQALSLLPESAAAQFLSTRTYRGLDLRLGEDTPSVLEQGRSGIARGYQTDRETGAEQSQTKE